MTDTATAPATAAAKPSIRDAVAEALGNLGDNTRAKVIEHFAEAEATKRAEAMITGMNKLRDLERERGKLDKGDVVTYNEDGSEASATFSKERIDQRSKLDGHIGKLTAALNKADDSNDFGDLYNLVK